MDINMPVMDGIKATKEIYKVVKENERITELNTSDVMIVSITANDT